MEKIMKSDKKITNSVIKQNKTETSSSSTRFVELREQYNQKNHKNYTQKEFANKLGLASSKVSELESGKRTVPSLSEALAYNKLTEASLEYIFDVTTDSNEKLGLTNKSTNNLRQLKDLPNTKNAFMALNHLLSSPDAIEFLNMLYQLWISPIYNMFDSDLSQLTPGEVANQLLQTNSPYLSYAVKCNVERQLLNYIDAHGIYQENEYKK